MQQLLCEVDVLVRLYILEQQQKALQYHGRTLFDQRTSFIQFHAWCSFLCYLCNELDGGGSKQCVACGGALVS